ncbi:MAG TPA: hypothetical protein VF781_15495 [Solirubrobacteraceae bacterium]
MTRRAFLVALLAPLGFLLGRAIPIPPAADDDYLRRLRAVVEPVPGGVRIGRSKKGR